MHTICHDTYTPEELTKDNDLYFHMDLHHSFAAESEHIFLKKYVSAKEKLADFLKNGKVLILTLGTAISYKHKSSDTIVGNCHKMPSQLFDKVDLKVKEIRETMLKTLEALKAYNPELKILFTVSPVRHFKDGLIANARSKARLIHTVDQLLTEDATLNYFPAYELLIDELRDYRFFKKDLVHPNQIAVEFIWEKFLEVHATQAVRLQVIKVQKILAAVHHRAFNPKSTQHQKFLKETLNKITEIESELGDLFTKEKEQLKAMIV